MTRILLLVALSFMLSSVNCRKELPTIDISGFSYFDPVGFPLLQTDDGDWKLADSLSPREMALFDFPVTQNLDNTTEAEIINNRVLPAPNPASQFQGYFTQVSDSVLMKLVIVDKYYYVMQTASHKSKGHMNISVDLSDRKKFPSGLRLRAYFSFSAQGKPNYKFGYGDIMICDNFGADLKCR